MGSLSAKIIPEVYFSFNDHPFRKPSFVLYFCGCPHKCKNCHSPELQNENYFGCQEVDCHSLLEIIKFYHNIYKKYVESLVLLGGDPVVYAKFLQEFLKDLKADLNFEVVLYTGFLFEDIDESLKDYVDIIVDGKYIDELKTNKFPASSNQRIFVKDKSDGWIDITSIFR